MSFDATFNPCAPLIVGFIVSFVCSIYPATMNRKINENGILFTFPHLNRFVIPAVIASIVAAIIQACGDSLNGDFALNQLQGRTPIQQGGWEIVGLLISAATSILAGLIVGIIYKVVNGNTS